MINSRNKGLAFEREIARKMRPYFPNAKRGLQYQAGEYVPDVVGTPFYIECKRGKKFLSVNFGTGKSKQFNPANASHMFVICNYYYDRMLKYNDDQTVIIVWKLDRKPIQVTIYKPSWKLGEKLMPQSTNTMSWEEWEESIKMDFST